MSSKVQRQIMLMDAIERPFKIEIYKEKNRYIRASAIDWQRHGSLSETLFEQHIQNMQDIFNKYYGRTFQRFSAEIMRQVKLEKRFSIWEQLLLDWFTEFGGSKAKEVAGTTRDDINRAVRAAFESGEPEGVVVKEILRTRGLSAHRADAIARTETHNAAMYASEGTARSISADAGLTLKKVWNPAEDDRTRIAHADMTDHPPVDLDSYFVVGGERMLRPGDPSGSAANVINCRCVLTYEAD